MPLRNGKTAGGWSALGLLGCAAIGLTAAPAAGQVDEAVTADSGWVVLSKPHVDLWYHGLAVIGFDQDADFPLYNPEYAERVRSVKEEMGVYPTALDEAAEKLRKEFEKDDVFQHLHFMPLYFPVASRTRMLQALTAVAERNVQDSGVVGPDTRAGVRYTAARFRSGKQRRLLGQFVEALEEEWAVFLGDYWQRTAAQDSARYAEIQRRWDRDVAPAVGGFLRNQRLENGRIFVSPALGPEGRLVQANAFRGLENGVAVWSPDWDDPKASLYAVVRELCFSVVGDSKAAVRCGALVLETGAEALVPEYQTVFVRAVDGDTSEVVLADVFEQAYEADEQVLSGIRSQLGPARLGGVGRAGTESADPGWTIQPRAHADLWFHALAVIQADEPGPLGLYSADYARSIRQVKQDLGLYPTALDVLASELRQEIADHADLNSIHFVPLYFPRATPERMLGALRAVAKRRTNNPAVSGSDVRFGARVMMGAMQRGGARRLLESLVDAAEEEWELFYRDYWERQQAEQESRYTAIQSMWDSVVAPVLGPYLERQRLSGGLVTPSPAVGPEGRIIDVDEGVPGDQVVAVQLPPDTDGPEASVFAFLKELCFVLVDDRKLRGFAQDTLALEDLRRTVAVRCGALLLDFYAPTLGASYRRVFLDAVGAEESATVGAFERVYALDPEVFEVLREQIRGR